MISNTTNKRNQSTNKNMSNNLNTTNLKQQQADLTSHQSSSSIERLDGNFCGAFQEHYEYLMDKGLIETCQV